MEISTVFGMIIAFFVAVFAGMGVGGGGLLIVWLSLFSPLSPHRAQGINLLFFICTACSALPCHFLRLRGKKTPWGALLIPGLLAAIPAAALAHLLPPRYLRMAFGAFCLICGIFSIVRVCKSSHSAEKCAK